jgi:hypothetical protein
VSSCALPSASSLQATSAFCLPVCFHRDSHAVHLPVPSSLTSCGSQLALSSIDSIPCCFPLEVGMKVTSMVHFAPASSVAGQFPVVALNSGPPETPSISTGKRDLFFFPFGFETLKCFIFDAPTLTEPKSSVCGIFRIKAPISPPSHQGPKPSQVNAGYMIILSISLRGSIGALRRSLGKRPVVSRIRRRTNPWILSTSSILIPEDTFESACAAALSLSQSACAIASNRSIFLSLFGPPVQHNVSPDGYARARSTRLF